MLGALFFAAALTPTLIPRSYLTQGALAGGCFAIGYFAGVLWRRLWHYLELPEPSARARSVANALVASGCLLVVVAALWRTTAWQNAIRGVMKMAPVETAHPLKVCLIALITFVVLLVLGRLFALLAYILAVGARRIIPRKVATVIGVIVAGLLFWSIANNLLIRTAFNALDSSFRELDVLFEPERAQPTAAGKTGSPASLVKWTELGRMGRRFIASGPTAAEISTVTEHPAQEPVRVYVGLAARETAQARARLALDELKRQRGFERKILIVITPTGTGWIDPAAMDTVEYLHHGDVASVAMQYSYLNSPLSLLFQPEYGAAAARALFAEIYGYWTTLPKDQRPKLYLHGLSLGAMNSEKSAELFETIGDPIAGALWSGAPFESRIWRSITDNRNPDTPAWLPEFRDSRFVRFMNQNGPTVPPDRPWGAMRVVYLQYASDAITFFAYRDAYRAPAWMNAPRGPDVAPELRWYPIVTMLQLALDMAVATHTPMGFGHVYAPEHYVDAWVAVTDVNDWSAEALAKLKSHLAARARQAPGDDPDRGG
ncbi:alpha/beta-hydrolase family protein [Bradyrhizobium sp. BR 10261]|uniref:alpha/beta hydrolase n=1 Tax=Bradyrhizobium sp. BR 10261 TaxID=2749992 RepID=UPI001C64B91F|nr:alpha/beta-hydrolase family protein [Bradyrhizobium sp. BR 10261]MBW7964351.1 alpha/beta-hydrolase family protein [Bradyrhizobium sp. BR 10261]